MGFGDSDDKTNIKTLNMRQTDDQPHNVIDEVQIKQELHSDSDIEVGLAYRIIDTFDVSEVRTFKQESEQLSPDTETSLKIGQTNNKQTQLKVEMDNKSNLDCEMMDTLNVCDQEKNNIYKRKCGS